MRFHLPGLPGQPLTAENSSCAYTQKVRRFAAMMADRGHEVYLYGGQTDIEAPHVLIDSPVLPFEDTVWGDNNQAVAEAIRVEAEPGDFLCIIAGICQGELALRLPHLIPVEYGIGYGGVFAPYRVFESYAWMHLVLATSSGADNAHAIDGRLQDVVIPNYFDVDDFPLGAGGDYLLYLGRMIDRKGVHIAAAVGRQLEMPLVFAGEGDAVPDYGELVGPVGPAERAELLGGARALLAPTLYVEPFGGAAVEAMLCGTPAITTDFGAFTETVVDGLSGYRCGGLEDFTDAVSVAEDFDREAIRNYAIGRYSIEAVAPQYEAYFERIAAPVLRLATMEDES